MNTHIAELRVIEAAEFAAEKHRSQRRKDEHATPYINHPLRVAYSLAIAGESDTELLMAALLHDTIEDTDTTYEELRHKFGAEVADLVLELTDDKRLDKDERKRRQVLHAGSKSIRARKLKLADKVDNVRDIILHPPKGWSEQRKKEYVLFSREVVQQIRGCQQVLENEFDELCRRFEDSFGPIH